MTNSILANRLTSLRNLKHDVKARNLINLLYIEEIWYTAYQNIYKNKGAFTKGTDVNDTLDDFSKERIYKIINSLKDMSYECKPSKRINIPKANGKTRPLSIPCGNDKLIQEACRIILEAIYEPLFSDTSHGFRPRRSCHTALNEISKWSGTKWWIEFDIKGCFDNIDHKILYTILEKKIEDRKFLGLIRKIMNAGYIDDWVYYKTHSGTPQGGIISPILANIYLNKLDEYVKSKCDTINSSISEREKNKRYYELCNDINSRRLSLTKYQNKMFIINNYIKDNIEKLNTARTLINIGKQHKAENNRVRLRRISEKIAAELNLLTADIYLLFSYTEIKDKIDILKTEISKYETERDNTKSRNDGEFERLHYVRYADDFVLGYIGNLNQCKLIFEDIKNYIWKELNLEISEEKSKISSGIDGIKFLSYFIHMPKKNNNEKISYINSSGNKVISKRNTIKPIFKVPVENAIKFVEKKQYGSYTENRSDCKPYLQNFDEIEIVKQYNAELRGLFQYYKHAMNAKDIIGKVQWLWQYSLFKTLAAKHKCSVAKVFKNNIVKVDYDKNTKTKTKYVEAHGKKFEIFNLTMVDYINISYVKYEELNDLEYTTQISQRSSSLQKLIMNECQICGKTKEEVKLVLHHPNKISNVSKKLKKWDRTKIMRDRKTIAVCHNCHMKIHHV